MSVKPIMQFKCVGVYQLKDVAAFENMIQLTKWLPAVSVEFNYLEKEFHRIMKDTTRKCLIVYHDSKIALFVNDMTDGAFAQLKDDEE